MKRLKELAKKGEINQNASIRNTHSLVINSPIEHVWDIITAIEKWSEWNPSFKKTSLKGSCKKGAHFTWTYRKTKGYSEIQQIDKPFSFSWTSKANWIKRIFVWSLEADENQTIVTLKASLQGVLVVLLENPQKVYDEILEWIKCLKIEAEN